MKILEQKKAFIISAAVAFSAVLVGAGVFGLSSINTSAEASDSLPAGLKAEDMGDGGLDSSTIQLATESENYSVWTARDRAGNICVITQVVPEGNSGATCGNEEQFSKHGLPTSMLIGTAEEGDKGVPMMQTYLLPEGADAKAAAEMIPGSVNDGQLVVRYGTLELERTTVITVPSAKGQIELMVFGRDSI